MLILTPVKDAEIYLDRYWKLIQQLDWPGENLSIGLLEGDSEDATWDRLGEMVPAMEAHLARVTLVKKEFNFRIPNGIPRWERAFQKARREVLAKARNHLLMRALQDEDFVLWLDVDVVDYPRSTIETLIRSGLDIAHPNCVLKPGGKSFDLNAWADGGKKTLSDFRGHDGPVRLESVGGTMLWIRADLHRDGLIFPPYPYGVECSAIRKPHPVWGAGEIETEGLAMMARDMGHQCWGLPDFEIIHDSD